jgi:hypothetical protein
MKYKEECIYSGFIQSFPDSDLNAQIGRNVKNPEEGEKYKTKSGEERKVGRIENCSVLWNYIFSVFFFFTWRNIKI